MLCQTHKEPLEYTPMRRHLLCQNLQSHLPRCHLAPLTKPMGRCSWEEMTRTSRGALLKYGWFEVVNIIVNVIIIIIIITTNPLF